MIFKPFHYYLLYLVSCVIWQGMLIAMLVAWSIQGRPDRYWFMSFSETMDPVFLSDIGATSLKPLFAVGAAVHGALAISAVVAELFMRRRKAGESKRLLITYTSKHQERMKIASIFTITISELGILFTACFDIDHYNDVHFTMVAVFIIFMLFTILMDLMTYLIFWIHFYKIHKSALDPDATEYIPDDNTYLYFKWSFIVKFVWLVAAAVCVLGFLIAMVKNENSLSARFEWSICFWYGVLLLIWMCDIFPAAINSKRIDDSNLDHTEIKQVSSDESV
ncbi:hypothetical protein BABINDRAFT_161343 [Babjeviella inositovora NRRL Y-12698]|uniref:CWH43-like N-terminal domain-containing protein n=1 Tax=Babjeviella inositovora NRRL Y-12698 TaxID=984486 RepID=A0A1E3QTY4_9ASCO|nr:uncharacterized protein BABINDRAFT_161343 [Babjeviella inositovora NRRL Y-12698]ODQ80397.1 hypothetical protein BABINDRAFT_161343 [Babjeviella inositovora NRRL Y-12698]